MTASQDTGAELTPQETARMVDELAALWRSGGTLGQAMDITDDECEALYAYGHALYQQGKYADAMKTFAQVTAYNHMDARYQMAFGGAAQMLGRYEDALRQYVIVTMMRLDDPAPVYHSAECLLALGRLPEAAESLAMAIELSRGEAHAATRVRASAMLQAVQARMQ
ncbi:regulatory protein [Bordetella ansorpii]|uniref:Regulatory protein n=1 Tax=Bordetella ansorpii TaxID=288768 RepID=A0A157NVI0_9BORD|nr:SycD/LcrH family type III secretion system chaperone [Bordetella ansorpii]SAI25248.1 regulatory protein [Bordetella ansorpii]